MTRFRPIYILFIILISFFTLIACKKSIPTVVIQPAKLETILYDYHLAQAMNSDISLNQEEMRNRYYDYVFLKHHVTRELFDSSMVWYTRNPKHLFQIYTNLQTAFSNEIVFLDDEKGSKQSDMFFINGDTIDLWQRSPNEFLSSVALNNRLSFSFDADSTYQMGDSIVLSFKTHFIYPQTMDSLYRIAHAALLINYADSTIISEGSSVGTSGFYSLELPRDYEREIKKIRGFIYYSDNDSTHSSSVLFNNISLKRIHPPLE